MSTIRTPSKHIGVCDCGDLYLAECPECKTPIKLSNGMEYWPTECPCGFKWELFLYAEGTKPSQ